MTKSADKAQELHDQLTESIEALVSSDDWVRTLETASKFHNYSFGNVMLITLQRPDASRVAGFKTWQSLGRQVRKGEKGIGILAPMVYKREVQTDSGETEEVRGVRGFRSVYVFDIAQTEGDDLDEIRPEIVQGESPESLWDSLAAMIEAEGFSVELADPDTPGANGTTNYTDHTVKVRPDLPAAQRTKTLAHELGHVLLHDPSGIAASGMERSRKEVEAESVAYIVCQASGMVTDDYSFPYVAIWAQGNPEAVANTGTRVVTAAKRILEGLGA